MPPVIKGTELLLDDDNNIIGVKLHICTVEMCTRMEVCTCDTVYDCCDEQEFMPRPVLVS